MRCRVRIVILNGMFIILSGNPSISDWIVVNPRFQIFFKKKLFLLSALYCWVLFWGNYFSWFEIIIIFLCRNCKEDKTAYEVLRLEESNRFNTSGTLNVNALLPGADSIWSSATPDVSNVVLLADDLKANLSNFDPTQHDTTLLTMTNHADDVSCSFIVDKTC